MDNQQSQQTISVPGAIVIAAAILAIAIIWVKQPARVANTDNNTDATNKKATEMNIRPITSSDHIYGNPSAPIRIVEYSDTSCPYCKIFNTTMEKIMNEYGPSGKVAWVYRHFPLDKPDPSGQVRHPNAGNEAQALECAGALGGNDKFWAYEKKFYETTTSDTGVPFDQSQLPQIAKSIGLDIVAFNECLSSGQFKDKVEADYQDGAKAGILGTPYSIIISANGTQTPIEGALPYQNVKIMIESLLSKNK